MKLSNFISGCKVRFTSNKISERELNPTDKSGRNRPVKMYSLFSDLALNESDRNENNGTKSSFEAKRRQTASSYTKCLKLRQDCARRPRLANVQCFNTTARTSGGRSSRLYSWCPCRLMTSTDQRASRSGKRKLSTTNERKSKSTAPQTLM